MKIHVASETQYIIKGNGVHTAFIDHVELLSSKDDIETVVNNEGKGDIFHCHTYGPYYFLKGIGYKGKRVHTAHVIPDSIKKSGAKTEIVRIPNPINSEKWRRTAEKRKKGREMLFTSYQENCPLAPIEGAASGMPVIFRDIEEYKTLYDNPYLKAGSTNEFIHTTRMLMNNAYYYSIGLSVSRQLITQFDKDRIRVKLVNLYERLNNRVPNFKLSWLSQG